MTTTQGAHATYKAGSLMLYPWLKPAGLKLRGAGLTAHLPTGRSTTMTAKPVPGALLPQDEYFCRFVLKAPWQDFIGFAVDAPSSKATTVANWRTTIPKLADGQGVDIEWTSANLNGAWFGGSRVIPSQPVCNGSAWRALIATHLGQVAAAAC